MSELKPGDRVRYTLAGDAVIERWGDKKQEVEQ